jgi:hypothetical protein
LCTTDILRPSRREIRVLDLAPGKIGKELTCSIRVIGLDSDAEYEALSYVWGDLNTQKDVDIGGQRTPVTDNLHLALQRLRHPTKTRTIWIDQLCINQSDNLERSSQVAMMRDIYQKSSCCIIWLGELEGISSRSAADVFDFIKEVAAFGMTEYRGLPTLLQNAPKGGKAREAFAAFAMYGNPWWSRIWTIQEAIIPPHASFVWGHLSVSRQDVSAAAQNLRSNILHSPFDKLFEFQRVQHYELLRRMIYPVHGFIYSTTIDGPLDLLMRWRHRDATDPRDKVYALMGLLPDTALPSARGYDYEAPASLLFANVTFDLIRLEGNLRSLIGSCEMPHRTSHLPTWAIDFASTNRVAQRQLKWWGHSHRYGQFSACGQRALEASLSSNSMSLSLTGLYLDKIEVTSNVWEVADDVAIGINELHNTLVYWDELLQQWRTSHDSPAEYVTGETWESAFFRTSLGDLIMKEYPVQRALPEHVNYLVKWMTALMHDKRSLKYDKAINSLYESLCGMLPNQAFFVTVKGYIGVGPPDARSGDQVWILCGGQVPFVLRETHQESTAFDGACERSLVGDAYVHGIMDGEAVGDNAEMQTVRLY